MAVVEMQKLGICANKKNRKSILETLQSMGIMEMTFSDLEEDKDLEVMDTQAARTKYEKRAASFDQALKLLDAYGTGKTHKAGLFAEKELIPAERMRQVIRDRHKYNVEVSAILQSDRRIAECRGVIQKDENQKAALAPWMNLDIPMDGTGTKKTAFLIGTIPGTVTAERLYALAAKDMPEPAAVTADVVSGMNEVTAVAVICLKRDEEQVENNLRSGGFSRPSQPVHGIPSEAAEQCDREIAEMQSAMEEEKGKIAAYETERENFLLMGDFYRTRAEKYKLLGKIPQSGHAFFLEGWIPADKAERVTKVLEEQFGAAVEREEKREDETEPTLLHNNAFADSCEGVLESYGLPQHGRVDPTSIMAVFYVFFFGMMLSDAGYGIIMALACAVILLKHRRLEPGVHRFMKLFFWCGISTTFWGFMYGGFFGDAIDVIAHTWFGVPADQTVLQPIWFAPLNNPMRLLIWCMLFGIIHLYTGLGIKGYEMLKAHDVVGFLSDIVSWYLFLTGLIFMLLPSELFASISGMTFSFPAAVDTAAKAAAIIGAVIILIMGGRDRKNWAIRIALGAYDLYGVTSWLSDVLSYSRLLALGLATGVIASVINMMGSMFGSGAVKVIIFVIVFLLGHTLNIAINALGAYVHTNRLQYVEFFGKFYDAGGKPFVPFKTANKYIQIKEDQ